MALGSVGRPFPFFDKSTLAGETSGVQRREYTMSLLFALVLIVLPLIAVLADFVTAGELVTRLSRKYSPTPTPADGG
jgi:hypothetical protein